MRYSIFQLGLIPISVFIVLLLQDTIFVSTTRISYRDIADLNNLRSYRIFFENRYEIENVQLPATLKEIIQSVDPELPRIDSWGNPFQFRLKDGKGSFGCKNPVHVFSYGEDGRSNSNGNDPDDINSWATKPIMFYTQQRVLQDRNHRLLVVAIWTPILFFILLFVQNIFQKYRTKKA